MNLADQCVELAPHAYTALAWIAALNTISAALEHMNIWVESKHGLGWAIADVIVDGLRKVVDFLIAKRRS